MQGVKGGIGPIGKGKGANKAIKELAKDIEKLSQKRSTRRTVFRNPPGEPGGEPIEIGGFTETIPEGELSRPDLIKKLRVMLDKEVGDAYGKESGAYLTAVKKTRHWLAERLADNAKGTPYEDIMRGMAQKYQLADEFDQILGKSAITKDFRAQSFIDNLFGRDKEKRQKMVELLGKIYGKDFLEKARLTQWAKELGPTGAPTLFPRQTTGRALLGPAMSVAGQAAGISPSAVVLPFSSPRIATTAIRAGDIAARKGIKAGALAAPYTQQLMGE
jgi:hypothetical protein